MGMSLSVATEHAKGMLETGELASVADANVEIVRMMGVRLITSPIPQDVRRALLAGVKAGRLDRLPKKGDLPEAFCHPNGRFRAVEHRERFAREKLEAQLKALRGAMT